MIHGSSTRPMVTQNLAQHNQMFATAKLLLLQCIEQIKDPWFKHSIVLNGPSYLKNYLFKSFIETISVREENVSSNHFKKPYVRFSSIWGKIGLKYKLHVVSYITVLKSCLFLYIFEIASGFSAHKACDASIVHECKQRCYVSKPSQG